MHVAVSNRDGGIALVTLHGPIDISTAAQLREAMHALYDAGHARIVVDLSGVDFCDSIGLGTFADGHNRCIAAGGFLRLAGPSPLLADLLHALGLSGPIPLHDTVDAALDIDIASP